MLVYGQVVGRNSCLQRVDFINVVSYVLVSILQLMRFYCYGQMIYQIWAMRSYNKFVCRQGIVKLQQALQQQHLR